VAIGFKQAATDRPQVFLAGNLGLVADPLAGSLGDRLGEQREGKADAVSTSASSWHDEESGVGNPDRAGRA